MTVRRDARHCVTAEGLKVDVAEGRMRFVPVLHEFITGRGPRPASHFQGIRGFIAGANSAIRQRSVTLPPHFTRREPAYKAAFGGRGPRTGRTRDNRNGSSDCIGPAVGPGAGRHFGRDIGSDACGRARVGSAAAPKAPAQKQAPAAQKQAPAAQPAQPRTTGAAQSRLAAISRSSCIRPG